MNERNSKVSRFPNEDQGRSILALSRDQGFQTALFTLIDTPEEWDIAMTDPAAWLRTHGLEVPEDLTVDITKQLSTSKPMDLGNIGMPDPDWLPFNLELFNCRTFLVPVKDEEGRIKGYEAVTTCFGFKIIPNVIPGGPIG